MAQERVNVSFDRFEQRLVVNGLSEFRNKLIEENKPTEDVNDILLKIIDAPPERSKKKGAHETR